MTDSRINLKNPWIAAVLAFLIPGAGHLYQGRMFKAAVYSICILGTFFYGMYLGEWQCVYYRYDSGQRTYGYFAQVLVGLPALPAIVQHKRYRAAGNQPDQRLESSIESDEFTGQLVTRTDDGRETVSRLEGRIELQPFHGEYGQLDAEGRMTGTMTSDDGVREPIELKLSGPAFVGPRIAGDPLRTIECNVAGDDEGPAGHIVGQVPRAAWNWLYVPLEGPALEDLYGRLAKQFELALVFTWIAGFLNILAVWDALEGPAYGYGDERPKDKEADEKEQPAAGDVASGTVDAAAADEKKVLAEPQSGSQPASTATTSQS